MKKIIIFGILILSFFGTLKAQLFNEFREISPYQKAWKFSQNDTLIIKSETAYIITKTRFDLYELTCTTVLSMDYAEVDSIIENLNKALKVCKDDRDSLYKKYQQTYTLSTNAIRSVRDSLVSVNENLGVAVQDLNIANQKLDAATKLIKSARREKYIWGATGVGIGLVFGIILGVF